MSMAVQSRLEHSPELTGFLGLYRFARDPLGSLERAQRLHGDAVGFAQRGGSNLLVCHPDAIEAMLVARHAEFKKDLFTRDLAQLLGSGLLTNEGEAWRRQRRLMSPSFRPREIEAYGETMVDCAESALESFEDGASCDLYQAMMQLALDVVARTLFGAEFKRFSEVEECLAIADRSYREVWRTWRAFVRGWLPLASLHRLAEARRRLDQVLHEIIREKRRNPGQDLLSRLITLTDDTGHGMSDDQVRDEAMTVFLAGHETTALALTYTLHLLATHPDVYREQLAEVDRELGGRRPSVTDAPRLAFTNAVLREGLRLYPPVWAMAREPLHDLELCGVPVKKGTQVIAPQWVVHRDQRWYREPQSFRPERWRNGECDNLPRFAYFPFGGGPRVCIGQHFALLETVLILARLGQSLRFERPPGTVLALAPVVTLRPKGPVRFVVRRRAAERDGVAA
jgi:cytochrome P450